MNYFAIALTITSAILAGRLFFLYEDLRECKEIPDFKPAVTHVKKYVGSERTFHFYVECTGKKILDDCTIAKPEDVTGQSIVLEAKKDGKFGSYSYVVDWVEEAIFYVDLSDESSWDIDSTNNVITFTMPPIKFSKVLRSNSYLPYVKDKKALATDEKMLINLIKKTDDISSQKVKEYLEQQRSKINEEMEISLVAFTKNIINKLGYSSDYKVEVKFKQ